MWTLLIITHAVAASFSLIFGAWQLLRQKGTRSHKIIGRVWVACMYAVIATSFGIHTLNGGFTWLHGLSLLTFFTVSMGIYTIIKGNVKSHKAFMTGSYFGIVGAFIGVIAVPSRRIPQLFITDISTGLQWAAIIATASWAIIALAHMRFKSRRITS